MAVNVFGNSIIVPATSAVGFGPDEATAVKITTGSGGPSGPAVSGSLYLRTNGTPATSIYMRIGGFWVPLDFL
jgi:hypothetical protein